MAGEKTASSELDDKAFELFREMVAKSPTGRGGEQQARAAYMKAEAFLTVREAVQSGAIKPSKSDGSMLTDCCAPNLHRSHPYNLVSRRFGDLKKINRIHEWLVKNPTPERDPEELVGRIKDAFPELSWDTPAINTARAIFPQFVTN